MAVTAVAFVGAAGGVGTTRITVECGTLLATEGVDVAILDAAYGTQGLADRTDGTIDPDMTALCLDDVPLEAGLVDRAVDGAGRLAVCPARAPFERLARAKTPAAAEAFETRLAEAARAFDHVLVDVPPIAANQAVAAATSADRVAVVCDAGRAASAVPRTRDRLADLGTDRSHTVITWAEDHPDADVSVPRLGVDSPAVETSERARDAVADVVESTLDVEIERVESVGLRSRFRRRR